MRLSRHLPLAWLWLAASALAVSCTLSHGIDLPGGTPDAGGQDGDLSSGAGGMSSADGDWGAGGSAGSAGSAGAAGAEGSP